jgi:hypothetical protein
MGGMRSLITATLVVGLFAAPAAVQAQDQLAAPQQAAPRQSAAAAQSSDDQAAAADLGISLKRIRRELRETPPTKGGLRYDFHVDVYGTNPKVDFFKDFDLSPGGAVRYGGMTHTEFLNVVTPQAFRAPSGDLIGLALAAMQQLAKKKEH